MFFKKKKNPKEQFVLDVIDGKITDMVKIALFIRENGKMDLDPELFKRFSDKIDDLQKGNKIPDTHARRDVAPFLFKLVNNQYEGVYPVVGVGYDNRQETIKDIKKRMPLSIRETTFKGDPSVEILYEGKLVGYISVDDVDAILQIKPHIKSIEVARTYTNGKGDKGLDALFILEKNAF